MNLSHRLFGVFISILTVVLVCGGCGVTPPAVPPLPAGHQGTAARAVITGITTAMLTDKVHIAVRSTEAVEYTSFTLQDPPRIVITLAGATLDQAMPPATAAGVVQHIDVAVVPEEQAVRLVVHLQHMTAHTVELQGRELLVMLADTGGTGMASYAHTAEPISVAPLSALQLTGGETPGIPVSRAIITGIKVTTQAERSLVHIQTIGAAPKVQVKQLQHPERLVLEVQPARLSPEQEKLLTVHDPIGIVTYVEATPVVGRDEAVTVTLHMRFPAAFEVYQEPNGIRLAVMNPPLAPPGLRPVLVGERPVATTTALPPAVLTRSRPASPLLAASPRVAQVAPLVRRGTAPAVAAPRVPVEPVAQKQPGLPPEEGLNQTPIYTGEKISLDFQDADINDILRLIAEVGGVNIIAGGDVQGKVTTRMVDVPWDQALDVILKINGLDQERSGNIIRVAPFEKFTNERKERIQARVTEVQAEPVLTRTVPVNFAAAKDLRANLEKLLSNRGTIFIDNRTNTMIVTDTQRHLDEVFALVEKLDRPTPQVMIEARIVESNRTFSRELGVQLGLAYSQITDRTFPNRIDIRGGLPAAAGGGGLVLPQAPANFLLDLPAAVATGSGGAIGFSLASIGGTILDAQLSAMESSGRGKIISSPKIATLDNVEAEIRSGRKIPVQSVSAEGTKTEFVDAAITLKVTPHITPNDYIGMKIVAQKNEADFSRQVNGIPTIINREANTDMLVKDGDTVVIAGLYTRSIQSSRAGIPGLSSLPLIGALFRRETEGDTSDELLIFLTPRIIRQDDTPGKRQTALSN